jgi:hypothetical protein
MNAVTQSELFEPGTYLSADRPGYFARLWKEPERGARQECHELTRLPQVIKLLNPNVDTWISQATFTKKNRRAVNVRDVGLFFADLDTYKAPHLNGFSPEQQAERLCQFCRDEGLPEPSIVLFSGRGLQAKWLLVSPQSRLKLSAWNEAQKALVLLLEPFAADANARDVSRVLRLDRTVNTKSGQFCRVVHITGGNENCLARYEFSELSAQLIKRADAFRELQKRTGTQYTGGKRTEPLGKLIKAEFSGLALPRDAESVRQWRDLAWKRLNDIRTLWAMRGGVPVGYREVTLFWELNFLLLAEPVKIQSLYHEAAELAREISPDEFYRQSDLSTLYRKAQEYASGHRVEFQGRKYPPFYTPQNSTLLEIFRVTTDEEKHLTTIISRQEKYRRNNERREAKRRAEGAKQYQKRTDKPWEREGISRRTWYRKQSRGTNCSVTCGGVGGTGGVRGDGQPCP